MDKMTVNMIAGAVLSALLVLVGANTFIDILYPTGGEPEAPPQEVAGARPSGSEAAAPAADAPAAEPFPVLLANASVEAGQSEAKKCVACHNFDPGGANKIGPALHGIVGRQVASAPGFAYSNALQAYGGVWDYDRLSCFLANPKECVPGNKMAFAGIKSDKARADLIAYLRSVSPDAPPLPAADAGAAGSGQGAAPEPVEASAAPAANPPAAAQPAQN